MEPIRALDVGPNLNDKAIETFLATLGKAHHPALLVKREGWEGAVRQALVDGSKDRLMVGCSEPRFDDSPKVW